MIDLELKNAFAISLGEILEQERAKSVFQRDRKKIRACERALRNDAILERLVTRYEGEMMAALKADNPDGRFFEIIQWIIDNQDSIIKFILALIEIFG